MAVSRMKKLSAVSPSSDADRLISDLQRLACVEITQTLCDEATPMREDTSETDAVLAEAKQAVTFLTAYITGKGSLFAEPPVISLDDFEGGLDIIAAEKARRAVALSNEITACRGALSDTRARRAALEPWLGTELELPGMKTNRTQMMAGYLPASTAVQVIDERAGDNACIIDIVSRTKTLAAVYVIAHRDDAEAVKRTLTSCGFTKCTCTARSEDGFADGEARRLDAEISRLEMKLSEQRNAAVLLSESLVEIKALCDICETRLERTRAKALTAGTQKTVILCGWVPEREQKRVTALLEERGCAYSFDEPEPEDDVPVLLSNNRFASNFEPVLSMYALPVYGRFDPTMIMSLFYVIIFGLMFADVGYGLLLLAGCLAGMRLMKSKPAMKRFLSMFAICAVSCIAGGVLFGGYFGDLPVALLENFGGKKDVASPALAFDMIDEPIMFLVISLAVGAVHLVCAMVIKFIILVRDGHIFDAIADVGSWLVLFSGIGVYFLNSTAGIAVALLGVLMLIGTQGRNEKNIFLRIGKGIMSLYDIVSYASDLLSYSRILALSLASAVIASVFNMLATMGGLTIPGILLFIIVFLAGHAINFAVNILGTYVHTSRLQYIEFFGKFYESGGREFTPLTSKSQYVNFK